MPVGVLHLTGSPVDGFLAEVSRLYAANCLRATADPRRYRPVVAWVSPDGSWRFPADLSVEAIAEATTMAADRAITTICALGIDVVVPQMFCLPGMTTYRGLLDLLGLPYVGNPPTVMGIGADKATARAVVAAAGVDIPAGELLRPGDEVTLTPPAVVKPVDADNSLGVAFVQTADEYPAALAAALSHSPAALVETFVPLGREVRCGIVEYRGDLVALPLEEYAVDAVHKPVRLPDDKLARTDDGELRLVAKDADHAWIVDPSDPITPAVQQAARRAHTALGCRDYSLFDFRVDPDGKPWFLEASLYNSFSSQSVLAVMAAAAGIGLRDLFGDAVDRALSRDGRRGSR